MKYKYITEDGRDISHMFDIAVLQKISKLRKQLKETADQIIEADRQIKGLRAQAVRNLRDLECILVDVVKDKANPRNTMAKPNLKNPKTVFLTRQEVENLVQNYVTHLDPGCPPEAIYSLFSQGGTTQDRIIGLLNDMIASGEIIVAGGGRLFPKPPKKQNWVPTEPQEIK